MHRSILWTVGALLVAAALLSACGGGPAPADSVTPSPEVVVSVTPPSGTSLSVDKAVQVARDAATAASYLEPDKIQEVTVDLDPSGMWTITFKGLFYKPQRLSPAPTGTPGAQKRLCSEVKVWVADSTGEADEWTFAPVDGCS